jgi:type III secretion apparatus needle protein
MAISSIEVNAVYDAFNAGVSTASTSLKTAIDAAALNVNDPTNLISMQKELANYNMALMVQSSVIKSIEETAKSITQKL